MARRLTEFKINLFIFWGSPYVFSFLGLNIQQSLPGYFTFEAEDVTYTRHDGYVIKQRWKDFKTISIRNSAFVFRGKTAPLFLIVPYDVFQSTNEIQIIQAKITKNVWAEN